MELVCGMANLAATSPTSGASAAAGFLQAEDRHLAKALLFPDGVNALGDNGDGMTVECWYHPKYPYTSDVTGMTAQQYCDAYETDTGQQWTQPICFIGCFELWTDVLKRTKNPMDKNSIVEAIKATKVTAPAARSTGPPTPSRSSATQLLHQAARRRAVGQGHHGKYKYDLQIVASARSS